MTKKQVLVNEIKEAAKALNISRSSFSIRTSTNVHDFPIEVVGDEWASLPIGAISQNTDRLSSYLQGLGRGWLIVDADRSGIYLKKNDIIVRFC